MQPDIEQRDGEGKDRRIRGVYLLPNIFTTLNLFFGFYGIVAAISGKFHTAAIAIILSAAADILDGKVARFTGAESRFGVEYDSLADLVAFGVGPGVLVYLWALKPFGRLGWLAAFLYLACGALRLARFNVQVGTQDSRYFNGLPIPGAALMISTTVLLYYYLGGSGTTKHFLLLIMTYALSFLMVSSVKYTSFKKLHLFKRKPFNHLVMTVLIITLVAALPQATLFSAMLVYVLLGPLAMVARLFRGGATEDAEEVDDVQDLEEVENSG